MTNKKKGFHTTLKNNSLLELVFKAIQLYVCYLRAEQMGPIKITYIVNYWLLQLCTTRILVTATYKKSPRVDYNIQLFQTIQVKQLRFIFRRLIRQRHKGEHAASPLHLNLYSILSFSAIIFNSFHFTCANLSSLSISILVRVLSYLICSLFSNTINYLTFRCKPKLYFFLMYQCNKIKHIFCKLETQTLHQCGCSYTDDLPAPSVYKPRCIYPHNPLPDIWVIDRQICNVDCTFYKRDHCLGRHGDMSDIYWWPADHSI